MVELACKDAVFHFNKKHLEDPTVPMWTIKTGGQSYYITHLSSNIPWSTKETPGNESTKGSIKFKNCKLVINDENEATLTHLTKEDKERLKKANGPYARILINSNFAAIKRYMDEQNVNYSTVRKISGGCGTLFFVCDIYRKEDAALLALVFYNNYRVLQPNELYYKWYDEMDTKEKEKSLWDKLAGKLTGNNDSHVGDDEDSMSNADESDWNFDDDEEE